MESITIGEIAKAIGTISLIGSFVTGIIIFLMKWWKSKVTDRFTKIDERLDFLEDKKEKYEQIARESKEERILLIEGLLACLDGLKQKGANGRVTEAIKNIDDYLIHKLRK